MLEVLQNPVYFGVRFANGCKVLRISPDGWTRPLEPRYDLRNHSPAGFEWGYGGSGPAQLALALVADVTGDDRLAQAVYQHYKFRVIGALDEAAWWLATEDVVNEVEAIMAEKGLALGDPGRRKSDGGIDLTE